MNTMAKKVTNLNTNLHKYLNDNFKKLEGLSEIDNTVAGYMFQLERVRDFKVAQGLEHKDQMGIYFSLSTIMSKTNIKSKTTVLNSIKKLIDLGVIRKELDRMSYTKCYVKYFVDPQFVDYDCDNTEIICGEELEEEYNAEQPKVEMVESRNNILQELLEMNKAMMKEILELKKEISELKNSKAEYYKPEEKPVYVKEVEKKTIDYGISILFKKDCMQLNDLELIKEIEYREDHNINSYCPKSILKFKKKEGVTPVEQESIMGVA